MDGGEVENSPAAIESTVRAALDMVIDDIRRSGHEVRPFAVVLVPAPSGNPVSDVEVHYGGHVFPIARKATLPEIIADIAFRLQDDVVDDAGAGWPMSTDGKRLLIPRVSEDGAAYWCDGDTRIVPVGGLLA